MTHPQPFDREQLDRELQAMLIQDAGAVHHALYCSLCDSREVALSALALAGWTELEFLWAAALVGDEHE